MLDIQAICIGVGMPGEEGRGGGWGYIKRDQAKTQHTIQSQNYLVSHKAPTYYTENTKVAHGFKLLNEINCS